uniref:Uncharacterized protein n=1 Tax=Panagrolaimus davidi TaxID=227884 RepID=A0A914PUQ3_9BILA
MARFFVLFSICIIAIFAIFAQAQDEPTTVNPCRMTCGKKQTQRMSELCSAKPPLKLLAPDCDNLAAKCCNPGCCDDEILACCV